MAFGWLALLKGVPWAGVISTAPLVADGARQLWKAVSKKPPSPEPVTARPTPPHPAGSPEIAALEARVAALDSALSDLHAQMLKSSELINALAEQNTQLIRRVETNRVRTLWLAGLAAVGAVLAILYL